MKRLLILFLSACTIYCCINATNSTPNDSSKEYMSRLVGGLVRHYYYNYFHHPQDADDLIDYSWGIIKNNISRFITDSIKGYSRRSWQYEDLKYSTEMFYETLYYLEYFKENIVISHEDETFYLKNNSDGISVEDTSNICDDIKDFDLILFRRNKILLFDENQRAIFNYDFSAITKQLEYTTQNKQDFQYVVLKYEKKTNELTPLCPIENINNSCFNRIHSILYDFAKEHKTIYSIIVLTPTEFLK